MGFVLGQSGWVLGTVLSICTVVLLRECGSRLVGCCEELQARGLSAPSYTTIGREAFGEPGRWVVLVAVVLELWLGIVWLSIVAWNNCALMLAGYPLHWLLYVLLLATTATVWLRTLKQVGWLSLFAATALLVCVASIAAQLRLLPRLAPRDFSVARWDGVGASTSIIAAAFAGHVALPTMYGAMQVRSSPRCTCEPSARWRPTGSLAPLSPLRRSSHSILRFSPPAAQHPSELRRSLTIAYVGLALVYGAVGLTGYVMYGDASHSSLLTDMGPSDGHRVSHTTRVLLNVVLAALTLKASCTTPLELQLLADVLSRELHAWRGVKLSDTQALQLRMLLWLPAAALSIGAFEATPRGLATATGSVAALTSGLMPVALYLRLRWAQLSTPHRALLLLEGALALLLAVAIATSLPAVGILPSLHQATRAAARVGGSAGAEMAASTSTRLLSNAIVGAP